MLVSTRGGRQLRMPLIIMQQRERTPTQDFAGASDESSWDEAVGIDGLAMPISIKTRRLLALVAGVPEVCCPRTQSRGEHFGPTGFGKLAEKTFRMAIPIGSLSSCHHCQGVCGVASQVMHSTQAAQREEQQRQQQLAQAMRGAGEQRARGGWLT